MTKLGDVMPNPKDRDRYLALCKSRGEDPSLDGARAFITGMSAPRPEPVEKARETAEIPTSAAASISVAPNPEIASAPVDETEARDETEMTDEQNNYSAVAHPTPRHTLGITVYSGITDNVGTFHRVTKEDLQTALSTHEVRPSKHGRLFNLVRFDKNNGRYFKNVKGVMVEKGDRLNELALEAYGIVLDIEHTDAARMVEIQAALDSFGYWYQIHTTHRSRHDEPLDRTQVATAGELKGTFPGECRVRVTLLFDRPAAPVEYDHVLSLFEAAIPGIDKSCRDRAHFFYLPSARPGTKPYAATREGRLIPVDDFMAMRPPESPARNDNAAGAQTAPADRVSTAEKGLFYRLLENRGAIIGEAGEDRKWWVRCPNFEAHGTTGDTDTTLWAPRDGETLGSLCCSHDHCKDLRDKAWLEFFSEDERRAAGDTLLTPAFEVSTGAFSKVIKKLGRSKGKTAAAFEKLAQGLAFENSAGMLQAMVRDLARELPKADPASVAAHFGSSLSFMALKGEVPTVAEVAGLFQNALDARKATGEEIDLHRSSNGAAIACSDNVRRVLEQDPAVAGKLKFNDFSGQVMLDGEVPWESGGSGHRELVEKDIEGCTCWLMAKYRLNCKEGMVYAALKFVAQCHAYHPVREYLDGVVWDGTPRLESWLVRHFGAEDSAYTRLVGTWWLTQAAARIYEPGCQADYTLILKGPQGRGKSKGLGELAGREYFCDDIEAVGGKDTAERLQGMMIVELGELDAFKKAESSKIKAFLTRRTDRYREPYEHKAVNHPRQCVFAGSTNDAEFLTDITGNRRYWVISVSSTRLDTKAIRAERDQLWAEAVARYRAFKTEQAAGTSDLANPHKFWPEADELDAMFAAEAEKSRRIDPWEEKIRDWMLNPVGPAKVTDFNSLWVLRNVIKDDGGKSDRANQNTLGPIMTALGFRTGQDYLPGGGATPRYYKSMPEGFALIPGPVAPMAPYQVALGSQR